MKLIADLDWVIVWIYSAFEYLFGNTLSYRGMSELACISCQLTGFYMSYRVFICIDFRLCYSFVCFVLGINGCTLCLIIAEPWNFKLNTWLKILIFRFVIYAAEHQILNI